MHFSTSEGNFCHISQALYSVIQYFLPLTINLLLITSHHCFLIRDFFFFKTAVCRAPGVSCQSFLRQTDTGSLREQIRKSNCSRVLQRAATSIMGLRKTGQRWKIDFVNVSFAHETQTGRWHIFAPPVTCH